MTPFVIGTRDDVVGFALAGVGGTVCESVEEANRALSRLERDQVAIVSARFAECRIPKESMVVILPPR